MTEGELIMELMETFRLEAQDHLDALSALLIALERAEGAGERARLVESIFRRMHTLKGAAHAVNLGDVALRCQEIESLLSDLKRGDLELETGIFDRLHRDLDFFAARVCAPTGSGPAPIPAASGSSASEPAPAVEPVIFGEPAQTAQSVTLSERTLTAESALIAELGRSAETAPNAVRREPVAERSQETVRVPARLLESLLLQAEELAFAKQAASVLTEELAASAGELVGRATVRSRAQELAGAALRNPEAGLAASRLAGVVQDFCEYERRAETRLRTLEQGAERNLRVLRGMIDPLLEEVKKLHLLPFSTLTDPFYKLVRDLSRELDKVAELHCNGGDLEVDRRILAELKEPLLHLVRNVMDHGIEKPRQRTARGKGERGTIRIDLRLKDAQHAVLTVSDDGRGIDPAQVKATALKLGLVTPEAAGQLSDADALQLVFESGFSTSPMITALSGRGVGLAIVRESLERLGGHVTVAARPGSGTHFTMQIPLSFALIRGLLLEVAGRSCLLPASNLEQTARVPRCEIRRVENRDTVLLGGELFSLVSLASVLELGERGAEPDGSSQPVVLVRVAERRIAFAVDQVIGVQEVLAKPLGNQLARVRNVSGATVLGNGKVVPILNANDLVRSALSVQAGAAVGQEPGTDRPRRLSVLVAEDSITSRTLLKNILESSGYRVTTAIDGTDALTQLKTGSFDIVVSDVEMPRLDGFQLTAAIRADGRLSNLPVILVTGLESRSDRERGIEAGANAYVVKSSFDQNSLVDVIEKLT